VILLLNGAFGVGKTTVARSLVARSPRAILFDPELIGIALQRVTRVDDFQDLRAWRRLTILGIRLTRLLWPNVIVPMTFTNPAYLGEIRTALRRFDPNVVHVCLVAPEDVIRERLRHRPPDPWVDARVTECCVVHQRAEFATQLETANRTVEEIVEELRNRLTAARSTRADAR
jgi:predicted kinase